MDEIIINENSMNESPRYSEAVIRRAPLMAKWLWILFWVQIASNVIGLLGLAPTLSTIVSVITAFISVFVCIIYLLFRKEDSRFQTGAILGLIITVINTINTLVLTPNGAGGWSTFLNVVTAVMGLVMSYNLYYAYHQIIGEADEQVGKQWLKLWKWKIYTVAVLIGSIFIAIIIPILGVLVALAATIFGLVVSIYELVILYRSAQAYRAVVNYMQENK